MFVKGWRVAMLLALVYHVVQSKSQRFNLSRLLKKAKFASELLSPHHLIAEGTTLSLGLGTSTEPLSISELTTQASKDIDNSKSLEEQYGFNQTNIVLPTTTLNPLVIVSNNESRFRWADINWPPQGYLPRVPIVPGIPSGFRNPLASTTPPVPHSSSTSTTSTTSTTTAPTLYNPGTHYNFYGSDESAMIKPSHIRRQNITRVEHIAAECSNEYMKVDIRFNGTFSGLIYSSGYVHDPNCIYVNGSGQSVYEFYIRLNQCGTLGRQEMYHPSMPGEARRRDQLMWNTLSIQYNALIEEEFDEHFRLTCEYGSDFWKTVSFPTFNVEVNTGSPVVFTINPPQCQMEIRRGFGIAGSRTSGPVTVGDPLTLLIHMKSEKVGFDILVKNCVAHNGAQQRMLLIDANGCVTNDKLISPFRGTYNAENGHMVSLYSYLKAFRFTGSPALYLECDIHMCHNRCPPQRCYWRNLSKRSAKFLNYDNSINSTAKPILSESIQLYQALEVHHDQDERITPDRMAREDTDATELFCIRSNGLILLLMVFILLMSISLGTSICYCLRMRRLKYISPNSMQSLSKSDYASNYSDQESLYRRNLLRY